MGQDAPWVVMSALAGVLGIVYFLAKMKGSSVRTSRDNQMWESEKKGMAISNIKNDWELEDLRKGKEAQILIDARNRAAIIAAQEAYGKQTIDS